MGDPNEEADAARAKLDELRTALNGRIRALELKLRSKDGVLLREELATAADVRAQVLAAIRVTAIDVSSALETRAAAAAASALRSAPGRRDGFTAHAGPEIEAIVRGATADVASSFRAASEEIRQAIDRGISTSAPLDDLITQVAIAVDNTFLRASSAVDTAIIGAGRAVVVRQAERAGLQTGEEFLFKYVGPRDGKTRPFCREQVGKVFTRAALDALDNGRGQPKPASVFLGGYNCRHSLAPIPRGDAEADGIDIVE